MERYIMLPPRGHDKNRKTHKYKAKYAQVYIADKKGNEQVYTCQHSSHTGPFVCTITNGNLLVTLEFSIQGSYNWPYKIACDNCQDRSEKIDGLEQVQYKTLWC